MAVQTFLEKLQLTSELPENTQARRTWLEEQLNLAVEFAKLFAHDFQDSLAKIDIAKMGEEFAKLHHIASSARMQFRQILDINDEAKRITLVRRDIANMHTALENADANSSETQLSYRRMREQFVDEQDTIPHPISDSISLYTDYHRGCAANALAIMQKMSEEKKDPFAGINILWG